MLIEVIDTGSRFCEERLDFDEIDDSSSEEFLICSLCFAFRVVCEYFPLLIGSELLVHRAILIRLVLDEESEYLSSELSRDRFVELSDLWWDGLLDFGFVLAIGWRYRCHEEYTSDRPSGSSSYTIHDYHPKPMPGTSYKRINVRLINLGWLLEGFITFAEMVIPTDVSIFALPALSSILDWVRLVTSTYPAAEFQSHRVTVGNPIISVKLPKLMVMVAFPVMAVNTMSGFGVGYPRGGSPDGRLSVAERSR